MSWDGLGFQPITVKSHFDHAERTLNNMIPECLHLFGAPAAKWLTNLGIHAFQHVIWNPVSGHTTSQNRDLSECVEENFFGMGSKWKAPSLVLRPVGLGCCDVHGRFPRHCHGPRCYSTTADGQHSWRCQCTNLWKQSLGQIPRWRHSLHGTSASLYYHPST